MIERDPFGLTENEYERVEREMNLELDRRSYGVWLLGELEDQFGQDVLALETRMYASDLKDDEGFYFGVGIGIDLTADYFKSTRVSKSIAASIRNKIEESVKIESDLTVGFTAGWYVEKVGTRTFSWFGNSLRGLGVQNVEYTAGVIKGFGFLTASLAQAYIDSMGEEK